MMCKCQLCGCGLRTAELLDGFLRTRKLLYHSISIGEGNVDRSVRWVCRECKAAVDHRATNWSRYVQPKT
jgi:hypothetical protein